MIGGRPMRALIGMASVWNLVPVGFLMFMLSMGVALLRRRSRVKAVTEV
jgi:hypothetical protein